MPSIQLEVSRSNEGSSFQGLFCTLLWDHMPRGFLSKGGVRISGVVLYIFSYVAGVMHSVLIREAHANLHMYLWIDIDYFTILLLLNSRPVALYGIH